jgi:demethylmenaquinone methyltransferase/2-methoxy-6-polyprenyl-1,4-benzoquinol methylase
MSEGGAAGEGSDQGERDVAGHARGGGGAAEPALGGGCAREGDKGKGGAERPALDVAGGGVALSFEWGDALQLPYPDDFFDAATVGFGARNYSDLGRGLAEMARVVRPGGRVVVLEMTTPTKPPLSTFYGVWFDRVVPMIGKLAALVAQRAQRSGGAAGTGGSGGGSGGGRGDSAPATIAQAYTYLPSSVKRFHSPAELAAELERAGCVDVEYVLMAGGIIALHGATVPR